MTEEQNDNTRTHIILTKGTMVAHYRISEKIGAGGMGEVYLAEDTELGRRVALKFLPLNLAAENEHRARFKREAQSAAKLNHPNIVTIHEVSEFNGRPYIVMEHVEGRSLHDFCHDEPLPTNKIIDTAIQICDGLSKAHKAGIVHRDIKSSNIVVDSDGRPKILDFGLATFKGSEEVTKAGSTIGTVAYMSPEQAQGQKIDHRSDLFSFGIVLYELIAGRTPFNRDSDAATLKAIVNDAAEPLTRYRAEVPDELQRIVNKLLQRDPSLRYQNAADITADLKLLAISGSSPAVPAYQKKSNRKFMIIGAAGLALVATFIVYMLMPFGQTSTDSGTPMLVVLPFENLGSAEDEYFADGITDEITSRLASVSGLGVISRTSAIRYKDSKKSLPEIARELGVDYVLEGTIRWDKSGDIDRVRITPQLIRVSDDRHLWSEIYERTLTQVFAIQTDIAVNIADALGVTLLEPERVAISVRPTENLEAYEYYLRGNSYFRRSYEQKDKYSALEMYSRAVELDSAFAAAYAALSTTHSWFYWVCIDCSDDRLALAKQTADKAMKLNPNLPESHIALAKYYYYGQRDYESALLECDIARRIQPNNAELHMLIGALSRRQGNWDKAIEHFKLATDLSPQSPRWHHDLSYTLALNRRFPEAIAAIDRALSIAPDFVGVYFLKSFIYLIWQGDVDKARQVLADAIGKVDSSAFAGRWYRLYIIERKFDSAAILLENSADCFEKCYRYTIMGRSELAKSSCESARAELEEALAEVNHRSFQQHRRLGFVYAALGRTDEAIREGELALQLLPVSRDALGARNQLYWLAVIYTYTGEYEQAIDQLELLLNMPSWISVPYLRIDPTWDPLRDDPRFKALIEKYDKPS